MASYGGNVQKRGGSGRYQSLFHRDMNLGKGSRAPQSGLTGGASIWRNNAGGSDPPPPPCFTLEDRVDRSPHEALDLRSPDTPGLRYSDGKSPMKTPLSATSSIGRSGGLFGDSAGRFQSPLTTGPSTSPPFGNTPLNLREPSEGDFLHHHVHQHEPLQGGLLTLPTHRQIIRPDVQGSLDVLDAEDGSEWVTLYGFQGEDTNEVIREFEKCGPIVCQVPGPATSNWIHVQYQSRQDAQKALRKDGIQLFGSLIIGVKPVDPLQRQSLSQAQTSTGLVPKSTPTGKTVMPASRSYYLQPGSETGARALASPNKSIMARVVDLVFGL